MQITESDLERLVGTKSYRSNAVQEALSEGRAAYGPVNIYVDLETSMLEVEGPFFNTMLDLREMTQTTEGVSVADVREQIDDVVAEQTKEHVVEEFW